MTAPISRDLPDYYVPQVQDSAELLHHYNTANSAGSYTYTLDLPPNCISIALAGYSASLTEISVTGVTTGTAYLDQSFATSQQYTYNVVPVQVRSDTQLTIAWTSDGSVNDQWYAYGYIIVPPLALRKDGSLSVTQNHAEDTFHVLQMSSAVSAGGSGHLVSDALTVGQALAIDHILINLLTSTSANQVSVIVTVNNGSTVNEIGRIASLSSSSTAYVVQALSPGLYVPYDSVQDRRVWMSWGNTDSVTHVVIATVFYRVVSI